MKRSIAASVVAVALMVPAVFAAEQKQKETKPLPVGMSLSAMFARLGEAPKVTNGEHGMQIVENPVAEVVIARRNADGTVSTACVDSEAAARRFFAAAPKANAQPQTSQEK
jgi:hypothetical protein